MARAAVGKQHNKVVRWRPNLGPQTHLFWCPADIILFGGAAYGGKTDAMLIMAAQGTIYDGYQAIIFRRTYKELEKHIIERSRQLYGGYGKYNEKEYKWTFRTPDGGRAYIYLAYLERDKDVYNYHGGQFQFIGFDESTMFSEFQIRFMLTRLRKGNVKMPRKCKMLLCTNPIGPGIRWHKQIFIENFEKGKLDPGQIYHDAVWTDIDPAQQILKSTCFIPSMIWDNPVGLENDPTYVDNLRSQGPAMARALLAGSWDETLFMALQFDKYIHVVDPIKIPESAPRWLGIDWGKSDKASTIWQTSFDGRVYWYRDHNRPGDMIKPYAEEVIARSVGEKIDFAVLSHEAFSEHGLGHTEADEFVSVFAKAGIPVVKSDKDPKGRLMLLREFMRWTKDPISEQTKGVEDYDYWQKRVLVEGTKAWKEYAALRLMVDEGKELPKLQIMRTSPEVPNMGCSSVLKTLPFLTVDIEKPWQLADGQNDHDFDAGTYGLKGYVFRDETKILDAYMKQLGGKVPDSGFAAELALKAVERSMYEEDAEGDAPFRMESEHFEGGEITDFGGGVVPIPKG